MNEYLRTLRSLFEQDSAHLKCVHNLPVRLPVRTDVLGILCSKDVHPIAAGYSDLFDNQDES